MKYIFTIIISTTIFCLCNCNTKKVKVEILVRLGNKIEKLEKDSLSVDYPDCSYFKCDLEILNNTDTIFEFWTNTCSWFENWISTSDSVLLINRGCAKNFPKLYKISSKEKITYHSIVGFKNSIGILKNREIKFGFVQIKKNDISSYKDYDWILYIKRKNHDDVLWSEPIKIRKTD